MKRAKRFTEEFVDFLSKRQIAGLMVAFILGAASTKLIGSLVNDVVMPLVSLALPGNDWRAVTLPVGQANILVGNFMGAFIDFFIIALLVFLIVKHFVGEK